MRALIIGIDGKIGRALEERLTRLGWEVIGTSRRPEQRKKVWPLDLEHLKGLEDLPSCDHLFICAAMTKYADCQKNPEQARRVNVDAPIAITRHFSPCGAHIVFLSTNAVFNGTVPQQLSDSDTAPTSFYGRSKADAEKELLKIGGSSFAILRMTKVLSSDQHLFFGWISSLRSSKEVHAFHDMSIAPITLEHVIDGLVAIASTRSTGIFQASASYDISYFEAAQYLARRIGADPFLVIRESATDSGTPPEENPRFTSLDTSRLTGLLGRQSAEEPFEVIDRAFNL